LEGLIFNSRSAMNFTPCPRSHNGLQHHTTTE
jgi:hypothetical protein